MNYAYVNFYDLETNLKNIMYNKYSKSEEYGYEMNHYLKMHIEDIFELQRMNLLDNFCEFELEIMHMVCMNEQRNILYLDEQKRLTKK